MREEILPEFFFLEDENDTLICLIHKKHFCRGHIKVAVT